jgi:DNA modification methylase
VRSDWTLLTGDAREVAGTLENGSVHAIVTSPPYFGLRDYGSEAGQIGHGTMASFVTDLVDVFSALRDVLDADGTLWINIGDTYNSYPANRGPSSGLSAGVDHARASVPPGFGLLEKSLPNKSLLGVPWRLAIALQDAGWVLRQEIIWNKITYMPYTGRDRVASAHEHVFLFSKRARYRFRREPGGDVWSMPVGRSASHSATYGLELPSKCITLSTDPGMVVLDPFSGSATTGEAALRLGRRYIGIELEKRFNIEATDRLEKL